MSPDHAVLPVHRNPRKVPHMLVAAGQLVEERGLSAVLVPHQRKGQERLLRQGISRSLGMKNSFLTQTGVRGLFPVLFRLFALRFPFQRRDPDFRGVVQPQRQFIAADHQLHRIPHGGQLHHGHVASRNQTHVQKMLTQGALAPDLLNSCAFSGFQFFQRHHGF